MNTNKNMLTRLSSSPMGRAFRRLFGDECGQGMMEYAIIATVIAAAVAISFAYFGRSIKTEIQVASQATVQEIRRAVATAQQARTEDAKGKADGNQTFEDINKDTKK